MADENKGDKNSENGCSVIVVLAAFALLAFAVKSCNSLTPEANITNTSEIVKNTDEFINKNVTVRSKLIQKVGLTSFAVNDARFFGGKPIVVVNASGLPFNLPIDQNTEIQVTGQIHNLVIPEIEQKFKLKLQDEYYKDYINKPAIIARYMALAPKIGQVNQNPKQYYGRRVAVTGKVKNIRSPVLLTLEENQLLGKQDFLVLLKVPTKLAINKSQRVLVTGTVRPFIVADIERDYNLTWDLNLKKQLEVDYGNKPVLVAETVYPE